MLSLRQHDFECASDIAPAVPPPFSFSPVHANALPSPTTEYRVASHACRLYVYDIVLARLNHFDDDGRKPTRALVIIAVERVVEGDEVLARCVRNAPRREGRPWLRLPPASCAKEEPRQPQRSQLPWHE